MAGVSGFRGLPTKRCSGQKAHWKMTGCKTDESGSSGKSWYQRKKLYHLSTKVVWSHQPTSFASFGATKVYYSKKIKEKKPSAKTPWASDRTKTECSSGWCSWHVGDHQVDCYAPSHVGPPQWGGSMGPLCKPSTPCPSDLKNLFQKVSKIPQKLAAFAI